MPEDRFSKSDRDLQDEVIAYLADATLRRNASDLPLALEQAQRANRFGRFLARRYYRDRLARSFRYSRRFGASPENFVDTPAFDAFLDDCVLGSLRAAERVGDLLVEQFVALPAPDQWRNDLLEYERLFFLQAATSETMSSTEFPQPTASARCHTFSWDLPNLLPRLKSAEPTGQELRREVTLLFSRTHLGRIYVVEVDEATTSVFHAADGRRSPAQIAAVTSLSDAIVQQALRSLAQIGAVVASSAEEATA
jgi:hypothetical protein